MTEPIELTLRDVLTQIDRRLTRLEDDLRDLRRYVEERLGATDERFAGPLAALEQRLDAIERRIRSDFRWLLGIVLASWLSLMATQLLK